MMMMCLVTPGIIPEHLVFRDGFKESQEIIEMARRMMLGTFTFFGLDTKKENVLIIKL